ncbi:MULTISPECIES: post-PEP-CTERM-1 domain-containing protein [unclassified Massilia]|uniref:post-PEP-CTERM-1 domain-containing protein n=1 Tax=unclassified Massilia TaxID=2609279 RepID=UPI0017875E79|nr:MULTISPECIES: hypothetical protein [unclassified Massilia]MBD8532160.1 hypothetical protein [Massilia sp. CFBP 13647]MBD8675582.1 hypothetical protein [Massilia sp. CFBP 13721]
MSYQRTLAILPCALLCAGLSSPAFAQEGAGPAHPATTQSPGTQSGMIVVRDAQTGQLRAPTAAESRALAPPPSAAMRAQGQALQQPSVVTHPGGSRQVRLGERSLVYSVVKRGADGKLVEQCVEGAAAAEKAVHAPASTQHNEEHRHD